MTLIRLILVASLAATFTLTAPGCKKKEDDDVHSKPGPNDHSDEVLGQNIDDLRKRDKQAKEKEKSSGSAHGDKGHAGHGTAGKGSATLTLKGVMAMLGADIAHISHALWKDDFAAIARHAKAIADHPHVGPAELARLKKTLGKDIAGFVKHDKLVHDTAIRLHDVAKKAQIKETLEQLSALQSGCVNCHNAFRKRLTTKK